MMPRKRGKPISVARVRAESALGTLADETVLTWTLLNAPTSGYYLVSMDATVAIKGLTAGEGPLLFGVAHGDYSVAEIGEAIANKNAFTSDLVSREQAKRKVRDICVLSGVSTEEVSGDGKPSRTRLKFYLEEGTALNAFCYNDSGGPLTTGSVASIYGKIYAKRG